MYLITTCGAQDCLLLPLNPEFLLILLSPVESHLFKKTFLSTKLNMLCAYFTIVLEMDHFLVYVMAIFSDFCLQEYQREKAHPLPSFLRESLPLMAS